MVFKTLRAGFYRMWQFRRILVIYYLASLLFAIFAMIPARTFLSNYLGDSLWGERLANGADMHLILEFLLNADGFLPVVMVALVLASLFYWLGLLFLSGGAFSLYCHAERYQAREFWGQAGAFLGRFIRLGLYTLVVLALGIAAIQLITRGLQHLIYGSDPYSTVTYWWKWFTVAVQYIWIVTVGLSFDFARIYAVRTDARGMFGALRYGLGFVFSHLRRTLTLVLTVMVLIAFIALFLYNQVIGLLDGGGGILTFLMILLQQAYMLFRNVLRLGLYASEVFIAKELVPRTDPRWAELSGDVSPSGSSPAAP